MRSRAVEDMLGEVSEERGLLYRNGLVPHPLFETPGRVVEPTLVQGHRPAFLEWGCSWMVQGTTASGRAWPGAGMSSS